MVLQDTGNRLHKSPRKLLRRLSQQVGVSRTSTYKAVRNKMKFVPYKVYVVHDLAQGDAEKQVNFCQWLKFQIGKGDHVLDCTFTDDASRCLAA